MTDMLQEDRGLVKLHGFCIDMNAIWRPTPCHDLGVDGQIEFLDLNERATSTGKILAVQVKSGPSFFEKECESGYKYYPSKKHRQYWRSLSLPIILVIHNPDTSETLFAAVKEQIDQTFITIPKSQKLSGASRDILFELAALRHDPTKVLQSLAKIETRIGGVSLNGADFLLACLHPEDDYLEIRMARFHELLCSMHNSMGIGFGQTEYEFIYRVSMMILGFELTSNFAVEFDHQWYEMKLVPDIVAVLTPLGQRVSECLKNLPERYLSTDAFLNVGEKPVDMQKRLRERCQYASERMDAKDMIYDAPR